MSVQIRVEGKRTRWFLVITIILAVMALLDDYAGWRFLLAGFGATWWLSRRWAYSLADNLRLQREMRFGWAQVGDRMEERFTLRNHGQLPCLWVELVDHSNIPGYQASRVTGIEGKSQNQWRTQGLCTRRGLYNLGPTTLHTADPLGLYSVEIHDLRLATLMVTPPVVPLPEIEVAPGGRAGEGRPQSNAPERTVSAAGVREYMPGDSLRWVHWRTSARRDDFYVRTFESTPSGDWWIILDIDQHVQVGKGPRTTEEHAIILAASLADRGLRLGRAVGLLAYGKQLVWLPPKEGGGQRWQILRALALLESGEKPLVELLSSVRPTLGRATSLIIITPDENSGWLAGLLPLLWQGAVPTVMLLDPRSFGGEGDQKGLSTLLHRWGIQRRVITPDLLDRPEAHPGNKGQWNWRISPTGKAIALIPEKETAWRVLS
jgi:uncharacterized protein (DUF58 family)